MFSQNQDNVLNFQGTISCRDKKYCLICRVTHFYDVMGNLTGVFQTGEKEERKYLFEELLVYKEKFHDLHFIQYEYDLSQRMIAEINALGHKKPMNMTGWEI